MVEVKQYLKPGIRQSGYYWIRFLQDDRKKWEPGSWDDIAGYWLLIGSDQPWFECQVEVGPRFLCVLERNK